VPHRRLARRQVIWLSLVLLACVAAPAGAQAAARSTHVIIQNETGQTMSYVRGRVAHGRVTSNPPSQIAPGGTGELQAVSSGFMTGTAGYVVYRLDGVGGEARFGWSNPFYGSNSATASAPAGFSASYIGNRGNRTLAFYEIHPAGGPSTRCNAGWVLGHLGQRPEPSLSAFDRDSGFLSTPLKHLGFGGWVDTGCDAVARGAPVRRAQHSTDGFWTIDVRLDSMTINGQVMATPAYVRIEVEPETLAHGAAGRHPPAGGAQIAFHGHILIDTHHGEELIEVHPYDRIKPLAYGPDTCAQGFVWRDAFAGDHICVSLQARAQAAADNANAASRRAPDGGAYGPDTCAQGFVWREASPADHVCVTPDIRAQTAADTYRGNGCAPGFVWRDAFPGDYVCVLPQTRQQAADDNTSAASRRAPDGGPYGPDTCASGFVWREASPADHVCVTPEIRAQAAADNANPADRRAGDPW
jgi:hypothetical protein